MFVNVFGIITFAVILIIFIFALSRYNKIKDDYNTKLISIVDQVNNTQGIQFAYDKKTKAKLVELEKTLTDTDKAYAKKSQVNKQIKTQKLNIGNNMKCNNEFSELSKIRFSSKWSAYPDNSRSQSEISNDSGSFKKLMIVGNKASGVERTVGIWDKLDVHGAMSVDKDISAETIQAANQINIGNAAIMKSDGYIYGGGWIDGKNVKGRNMVRAGNNAAILTNDGTIRSELNMYSRAWIDGQNVKGRDLVIAGNNGAHMRNDGNVYGKQVCVDGICLNKNDLSMIKQDMRPVNCSVSDWTPWSGCGIVNGQKIQTRTRSIVIPAENGGSACPSLEEKRSC